MAFVTGAGSGIGQMIAYGLASAGARVVCFDLREDGGLAETVKNIEAIGGEACFTPAMYASSATYALGWRWQKPLRPP